MKDPSTITSRELLQLKSRDEESWVRLVQKYHSAISFWLLDSGVNASLAADIIQDVWLSALVSISRFQRNNQSDTFRGWLRTITRRRLNDHLKKNFSDLNTVVLPNELPVTYNSEFQILESSGQGLNKKPELQAACQKVKSSVHPTTWRAFEMSVLEERPVKEVMEILGIKEHTVYTSKSRVMSRLRKILNDEPQI